MTISLDDLEKANRKIKSVLELRRAREQLKGSYVRDSTITHVELKCSYVSGAGASASSLATAPLVDRSDVGTLIDFLDVLLANRIEKLRAEIEALGVAPPPAEREPASSLVSRHRVKRDLATDLADGKKEDSSRY